MVENFRPGVMEKWGLGPADLPPELIYTRISGEQGCRACRHAHMRLRVYVFVDVWVCTRIEMSGSYSSDLL